jgi:hypothetical protein
VGVINQLVDEFDGRSIVGRSIVGRSLEVEPSEMLRKNNQKQKQRVFLGFFAMTNYFSPIVWPKGT